MGERRPQVNARRACRNSTRPEALPREAFAGSIGERADSTNTHILKFRARTTRGTTIPLKLLIVLLVANGTPILLSRLLGAWGAGPVDGALRLRDGQRLFGPTKTWRGLLGGVAAAECSGLLLGLDAGLGGIAGGLSLLGDLGTSFVKRRMRLPPSSRVTGLDQLPEALLPTLCLAGSFDIGPWEAALVAAAFVLADMAMSRVGFHLGIRRNPH